MDPPAPLCLRFANTVGDRPRRREESLHGFPDLLRFAQRAGITSAGETQRLLARAARERAAAGRVFARALALREAIFESFHALAAGQGVPEPALRALNTELAVALRHLRLLPHGGGIVWGTTSPRAALDAPLWPIVRSAAELLVSAEGARVNECAAETCSWLFVDRSRGRRRRWCSMSGCGNREKAKRHYQRRRALALGAQTA